MAWSLLVNSCLLSLGTYCIFTDVAALKDFSKYFVEYYVIRPHRSVGYNLLTFS